jgi:hypothetical protein
VTEFCLKPETVFALLDEVSRHRALEPNETDMMEEILAMETAPFKWNPRLEVQLLTASHSPGGIRRFAERIGVGEIVARQKLYRLRKKRNGCSMAQQLVRG